MIRKYIFTIAACSILFTSCTIFHISTESLQKQFEDKKINPDKPDDPFAKALSESSSGGLVFRQAKFNNVRSLTVINQHSKERKIRITKNTKIKILKQDGSKVSLRLKTVSVKDSTVSGVPFTIFESKVAPIPFKSINRILITRQ